MRHFEEGYQLRLKYKWTGLRGFKVLYSATVTQPGDEKIMATECVS